VDREEFGEPRNPDHSVPLLRQSGEREALPSASAVHKKLYQRADSCGVQKRHSTHVENEMRRGFGPHGLDKIVHGLQAEFPGEPYYEAVSICDRYLCEIKLRSLHKLQRLTQKNFFEY
jgi:hypothetical protein